MFLIFYNCAVVKSSNVFPAWFRGNIYSICLPAVLLLFCCIFGYGKYFGAGWMKGQKEMVLFFFPQKPNSLLRHASGFVGFLLGRLWSILCPGTPNHRCVLCLISKRMGEIEGGSRKMPFVLCDYFALKYTYVSTGKVAMTS